ncbi:MAG: hypothetical protein ACKOPN_06545, partial [Prochlorococcaceae cyanobacterium]
VGSGATDPTQLLADLRAVADPLYGQLQAGDADGAWLSAWAELGAQRNRQRFAYRATIAGLLEREGWELQAPGPEPCPAAGAAAGAELQALALAYREAAEDRALIDAPALTDQEAAELVRRRRTLDPTERAALDRHRLAQRWGLGAAAPSRQLLEADRDGLRDRLRLVGIDALLADLAAAQRAAPSPGLARLERALRQGAHVLGSGNGWPGHQHLASQLLARLPDDAASPMATTLRQQAAACCARSPWPVMPMPLWPWPMATWPAAAATAPSRFWIRPAAPASRSSRGIRAG